jgi:hypothetical protein
VDTTIRNIDDAAYRSLKARAALEGRAIGELITDAIHLYLCRPAPQERDRSLRDWKPADLGAGTSHLSQQIDATLAGEVPR